MVRVLYGLYVLAGRLHLAVAGAAHELDAGDCLAMRLGGPIVFHNPTGAATRYVVALASDRPATGSAR